VGFTDVVTIEGFTLGLPVTVRGEDDTVDSIVGLKLGSIVG